MQTLDNENGIIQVINNEYIVNYLNHLQSEGIETLNNVIEETNIENNSENDTQNIVLPKKRVRIKKKKLIIDLTDIKEYEENSIDDRELISKIKKKNNKINNEEVKNKKLTLENYETLLTYNYKVDYLRKQCIQYKLLKSGNKDELKKRLYDYYKDSINPIKIQRIYRGYMQRRINKLRGPAYKDRGICINDSDFYTMDDMKEIPYYQFYSFKDSDNFIYGFDLISLYNLMEKNKGEKAKNPYNRNELSEEVKEEVIKLIKLSKIMKLPLNIEIKEEKIDPKKKLELRVLDLFQQMNSYGNYAHAEWFWELDRNQQIRFARELQDIWDYRAQLSNITKIHICPPVGNPFMGTPYNYNTGGQHGLYTLTIDGIIKYNIQIIENMIKNGVDIDSRTLGSFYVLAALTIVSQNARNALPWLYESVMIQLPY